MKKRIALGPYSPNVGKVNSAKFVLPEGKRGEARSRVPAILVIVVSWCKM
jgi:hypothetical protein